ncbi:hypothetical protein J3458_020272 [Metarhizium acridum]|uniref:Uncharacterized protein n=1 Tax=Metarhizium acridum (strain CQMa 102) TaxID=655827 RepID=E9E6C7_METAQ|nr:uncharacterized protein MAC_05425 [Metarhizium acridum CQMa 102]EFY88531.1 hypothetical protein MAC_05425 [Metarhizium acridum CQMa 102]KAG8407967.1 hypothetical protein J3458_020272 [Metarhizium acridum]
MTANVNKPTDIKQKEADINRKLQIYGIFSAFKQGKVPSNDQIDVALNSFLASRALGSPPDNLSEDGRILIADTREVIRLAKNLLLSKNEGNLIQDFIWQTTQFDPKSVQGPSAPVNKDQAKRDGDEALEGFRTLGTLLITNGQFRKLLKDTTILFRDMAGDAATSAAGRIRPSEEQLGEMDRAAEDNTWHDKPDFSKENLRKQAKGIYGGSPKKDAQDIANSTTNAALPQGVDSGRVDTVAAQSAVQQKVDEKIDPETKEQIKKSKEEYRRRAKEYFNKKMPEERKDQIIFRLKKMVLECQQHPEYSKAIQTLLRLAETYGGHGRDLGKESTGSAKQARSGFAAAEADLRTLIERFANGTSTSNLWESIGQIYKDADKDSELKDWFKSLDNFIRRCLLEQGYILDESSNKEWNRVYEKGRFLLREKYRSHTDRVIDETKFIADQFDQDPQNKAFGDAVQKLFNHLGNDSAGKSVFKPHLVKDLTDTILPAVLMNINYIPIPRIEYSDSQVDAIIENLILESDNFMPNIAEVSSEHFFRWGRKKVANKHHNVVDVKISGVQMDLRDVNFHVNRKKGFPSLSDTGVLDILLPGNGLSFRMKVATAHKSDSQNIFKVEKVDVDFKGLKIKVKKSNHKLLFAIVKPLALKVLRAPIQKAVEKAIKDEFNKLDSLLWQIKKDADAANTGDVEDKANFFKRYYDAAQKRYLEGKEKTKEVASDKKVNIAMTLQDSIFPEVKMAGGVSSKATEYKELSRKGDKWESPVFSIGSAKRSTDIPPAPKIENKIRPATNGRTNGHTNGSTNVHPNANVNIVNGKAPLSSTPLAAPLDVNAGNVHQTIGGR